MNTLQARWFSVAHNDLTANRGNWRGRFPLCSSLPVAEAAPVVEGTTEAGVSPSGKLSRHFIMGIVNLTPDSFSDGGLYNTPEAGLAHALHLAAQGADILDLGAESTRPGARPIHAQEELSRLLPVLKPLLKQLRPNPGLKHAPNMPNTLGAPANNSPTKNVHCISPNISIDTFKAETARVCLEHGVDIINDVSGGLFDPALPEVLAQFKPAYVLGHSPASPLDMQKNPHYSNVVEELLRYFENRLTALVKAGLPEEHIAIDPCIGFGKRLEHNLAILNGTGHFLTLGRPLVMAFSRKTLFREMLGLSPCSTSLGSTSLGDTSQLDTATHISLGLLAARYPENAIIHRVHEVNGALTALALAACFGEAPKS